MPSSIAMEAIETAKASGNAILHFLSGNDLELTGSHQAGPLLPMESQRVFPELPPIKETQPDLFPRIIWQDGTVTESRVTWYGRKTRSEYRLTRVRPFFPFGRPEFVGALFVLVRTDVAECRAYVLQSDEDIESMIDSLGLDIQSKLVFAETITPPISEDDCLEAGFSRFAAPYSSFPDTLTIAQAAADLTEECNPDFLSLPADMQLVRLMDAEYRLFQKLEEHLYLPVVRQGFEQFPPFIRLATSITQRRKARAGKSLEHHVARVLSRKGIIFDSQSTIENNDKPDMLFPGREQYLNPAFDVENLRVLAVKRTCRDRWRQVTQEAKRIQRKHLLTLQPEMSESQFDQIEQAGIQLVVPEVIQRKYPEVVKPRLQSVEQFVTELLEVQGKQN